MDKKTAKIMAYKAMDDIERAINYYKSTPNAKKEVIDKRYGYLHAMQRYISQLEGEIVDAKFNADVVVVNDNTNANARLRAAEKRIKELETILDAVGVDASIRTHMRPDLSEMKRINSINRAKETWPELY